MCQRHAHIWRVCVFSCYLAWRKPVWRASGCVQVCCTDRSGCGTPYVSHLFNTSECVVQQCCTAMLMLFKQASSCSECKWLKLPKIKAVRCSTYLQNLVWVIVWFCDDSTRVGLSGCSYDTHTWCITAPTNFGVPQHQLILVYHSTNSLPVQRACQHQDRLQSAAVYQMSAAQAMDWQSFCLCWAYTDACKKSKCIRSS